RAREAAEVERSGDAGRLAAAIRDYHGRVLAGGKLSMPERKAFENAKRVLASEIALVKDIPLEEAESLIESSIETPQE
ncbi:hypothetical protein, partial [Escherichia coli]|uniref:hypothetical protein n=1 Tax=Escherichia coli TaxID=562 RepID=UPI0038967088